MNTLLSKEKKKKKIIKDMCHQSFSLDKIRSLEDLNLVNQCFLDNKYLYCYSKHEYYIKLKMCEENFWDIKI